MNETAAHLLRDFANTLTLDVESSTDALTTPTGLTTWLTAQGLASPPHAAGAAAERGDGAAEPAAALALREALREAMTAHHDGGEGAAGVLDAALAPYPLRVVFGEGGPRLAPAGGGGVGWVVAALVEARAEGTWGRLKICPAEDCRWAFLDTSKNRSRTWCDMKVCGNRTKTRAYRARRTAAP